MFASLMTSFAAMAMAGTVPAIDPTGSEPVAVAGKVDNGSAPRAREQRYCVSESLTGSRMPRKVCKTRAEWRAEGTDVNALGK